MTAILLNQTNFDQAWAAETLYELIRPGADPSRHEGLHIAISL